MTLLEAALTAGGCHPILRPLFYEFLIDIQQ